jgi:GTPase SAR1 family protein
VEKPSIDHHYGKLIKQFVQDKAVRPVLGKAFETHCRAIDYQQLEIIWQQGYLNSGYRFPDEFDWRGVAKEYVFEVKGIVKGDAELRSLLTIDLQEKQTDSLKHLAGINPGLDVEKYRESLQCSYGYLKLYALDSTYQADSIKLWRMFIEQTVREALPPSRYEVPLDVKRQLQAEGRLEDDLSPEALAIYRQKYSQQPARKILAAIHSGGTGTKERRSVILGDPGAGKSTLLQYLALQWVEEKTQTLPLLIELREYVLDGMKGFLEFWHRGRGADWQFDSLQLHQHLLEQPTIVMFDGLDEVFDRATQSTIVDDIVRFSQQYPQAQVLVTSRIIGYNPERLQQAGFKQFTIQPLDRDEMHEFIDRWYDLALGADPDKVRLVNRLKDAIGNSQAIQNLADNPLLLTMMAILNREKEPPTKRSDLYDRASRVLLDKWDSESKNFPVDKIEPWVKQGILRHIAHEMQTSEEGLKGNLIRADRLVRILTDYLKDQGFEGPREKANGLIEQLRHRNWILCDRGADTYGFVHRTFLEYFCAMEIVDRFEEPRTITFEQLRDEVFGAHWQDETWHEVLRLICGAIEPDIASEIIEFLVADHFDEPDENFFSLEDYEISHAHYLLNRLLIAVDCFGEIDQAELTTSIGEKLLSELKDFYEDRRMVLAVQMIAARYKNFEVAWLDVTSSIFNRIAKYFKDDPYTLGWLKEKFSEISSPQAYDSMPLISAITDHFSDDPHTFRWLVDKAFKTDDEVLSSFVLDILGDKFRDCPETFSFLETLIERGFEDAILVLLKYYKNDHDFLPLLIRQVQKSQYPDMVTSCLVAIIEHYGDKRENLDFVQTNLLGQDLSFSQKDTVLQVLVEYYGNCSETLTWLMQQFIPNFIPQNHEAERMFMLSSLIDAFVYHHPRHSNTIEFLNNFAINDPDEQIRVSAQEGLKQMEANS